MEDDDDDSQIPDIHDLAQEIGANPTLDRCANIIARLEEQELTLTIRTTPVPFGAGSRKDGQRTRSRSSS